MSTKHYYLVRHAEKQNPTDPDTPISEAGRQRAIVLKETLQAKDIDNIIVSAFIRTQQTAKPLADAINVAPAVMDKDDLKKMIERMEHSTNSLVVGHTDNVPALIKKITGETVAITEDDFDNLFIITVTTKKKKLTKKHYGLLSP